ncbi:MAG: group II intron reverse transcriptase/maturase, partial [bacterium]|nr:group II intron reverse transcriptase/maturase [bacterium]
MALSDLRTGLQIMGGGWVLDVDIKNFFGALEHAKLRDILRLRMNDGTLLRFIGKWPKAGVLEEGN